MGHGFQESKSISSLRAIGKETWRFWKRAIAKDQPTAFATLEALTEASKTFV